MIRKKTFTALILLAAMAGALHAQDTTLVLSVKDAEQYALNHNKQLQNASLEVRKAEAVKWQTLGTMLPQVKAGFDYSNFCGYEMEMKMGIAGITIPMNPYGTLSVTASVALTGAQIVGTQLGELSKQMADVTLRQTEQTTIKNVHSVYLSILVMEKTVALLDSSLRNIQTLEQTALNSVKVGVSEQVDADQISIQVNSMRNNINASKRNLELLYNSMILQLGTDVNTKIVLTGDIDEILDINNIKGLLMLLTVFAHILYQLQDKSSAVNATVDCIYMFHMPAFVFVSGYFGKSERSRNICDTNIDGA